MAFQQPTRILLAPGSDVSTTQLLESNPRNNLLLASLKSEDYQTLIRGAKVISLKFRRRLCRQDDPIDFVYFPITCMISLLVTSDDKPAMEMATIGREGVVGAWR
jgi:hypothetical protein